MKSYTDLEQSKKLAEILPLGSADMFCVDVFYKEEETHSYNFHILSTWGCNTFEELKDRENKFVRFIPCWSLAALLKLLPKSMQLEKGNATELYRVTLPVELETSDWYIEPINACYEMILKLYELKMLRL